MKSAVRVLALTFVGIGPIGCFCINSLMFNQSVRHYDADHLGCVDMS